MAIIGTLVDGKYEILREIGRGGMSVVYLAMDTRLNKQWAIKEIAKKSNDVNNDVVVSSLLAEANLMKKLDHPTLPRIVDIIEESNTIYVVMDYIEGEPLSKVLELYGAQDQDTVIEWGKQLCDVLFYLHNCEPPIIYRDMKPANVMLKPDGTVKLIDFGIAREYKRSKTTDTESLGTRGYAAPEQFGGKGQTDPRTDIYSFGVTLYHLVTGKNPCEPPYELYPIKQINPNYYDGLQYLIQKCIQLNPEDRFQSCDEIRYVLDNIHEFEKGRRLSQNRKYKSFIAMIILCVVFLFGGGGSLLMRNASITRSFTDNIAVLNNTLSDKDDLQKAFNNITAGDAKTTFSSSNHLEAAAEYYEAIFNLVLKNEDILESVNISAEPDPISLIETASETVSKFDGMSDTDRANAAKACYFRGLILFKQITPSDPSTLDASKRCFSAICSEEQLNLASEASAELFNNEAFSGIFDKALLDDAKAFQIITTCYSFYSNTGASSSDKFSSAVGSAANKNNTQNGDDKNKNDNVKRNAEMYENLMKASPILTGDAALGLIPNVYDAYANILVNPSAISSFKSSGITQAQIDALYKVVYGESFSDVYSRAIAQYGENITTEQGASITAAAGVTGGISTVAGNSGDESSMNLIKHTEDRRFEAAQKIYNVYVKNN